MNAASDQLLVTATRLMSSPGLQSGQLCKLMQVTPVQNLVAVKFFHLKYGSLDKTSYCLLTNLLIGTIFYKYLLS